jgi:transcriptional regulator with XRE-family HTH domain
LKKELIILRTNKGLTRKELASALNVSENEISKLENNKSNNKVLYQKVKSYLKR